MGLTDATGGADAAGDDAAVRLAADVFARGCSSRALMKDVVSTWSVLCLVALAEQPQRFGELRRRVDGVSEKMLSQTLQQLGRDGLVDRVELASFPVQVRYSLTPVGRRVAGSLAALVHVLEEVVPEVDAARARHDAG